MKLTWEQIYERVATLPSTGYFYGIPRGGGIVAGLTGRAVSDVASANYIVDDIIDSGATRERWVVHEKPFYTLVDKQKEGINSWVQFPWEEPDPTADISDTVRRQLEMVGEDPTREGLQKTPSRVLRALSEFTQGYGQDPKEILSATFVENYDEMVVLSDLDFFSLCEHHMLPFIGKAAVAYLPNGKVVGVSKLARLVECFSRRLQIQERLTHQIANSLDENLKPLGVGVVLQATHLCMSLRGIKNGATMRTSCLLGAFMSKPECRAEFLRLATFGDPQKI